MWSKLRYTSSHVWYRLQGRKVKHPPELCAQCRETRRHETRAVIQDTPLAEQPQVMTSTKITRFGWCCVRPEWSASLTHGFRCHVVRSQQPNSADDLGFLLQQAKPYDCVIAVEPRLNSVKLDKIHSPYLFCWFLASKPPPDNRRHYRQHRYDSVTQEIVTTLGPYDSEKNNRKRVVWLQARDLNYVLRYLEEHRFRVTLYRLCVDLENQVTLYTTRPTRFRHTFFGFG